MQSLARRRGTGSAGGGPAGGVSSRAAAAVPKQPWKHGLSLPGAGPSRRAVGVACPS